MLKRSLKKNRFFLRPFFSFLSFFFFLGAFLKSYLYAKGFLKPKKVKSTVVSVGSIVAGGTGKTPLVLHLLKDLVGVKRAVLSRGYRSLWEKENKAVFDSKEASSKEMGDEPYLIKKRFSSVPLFVGKNRILSARNAKDYEVLILDDGFQHRKLHRDFEILSLRSSDLFGQNHFLPRGFLRDHPKELKRADVIAVLMEGKDTEESVRKKIQPYTDAPLVGFQNQIDCFKNLLGKTVSLPSFQSAVFCGIANPTSFLNLLKQKGFDICHHFFVSDHQKVSSKALQELYQKAKKKGALYLLCTEKDAVKLKEETMPIYYPQMILKPLFGQEHWDLLVAKISQIRIIVELEINKS